MIVHSAVTSCQRCRSLAARLTPHLSFLNWCGYLVSTRGAGQHPLSIRPTCGALPGPP